MEDTGQDTTIRIGVDGTGVSAGVTSIKRSLADLGTSVKSITDKTNAEISKIGSGDLKLDAGVAKATKAVIKQTGELEKQIAAFGSTAFTGFSNISKSAEAAYVSMAGKAIPTTYIDNYLTRLKEAHLLDAKRASDAKAVAEAIAASTAKTIAVEEHYADLKRQHAAYNKSLADQEIASTKARAAALAAYYTEAQNAELNLIHTGRGKSSAMLIDKGQRLGFTEAEINTYTAGLKKVEAANAAAFAAANPHIGKLKAEAEAAGTSVKGLSASLRNVPAQFTDIVVSLQGGQAPLTVLLQQGGQLKDMFGGVGNAARALGGYVLGLVNPFTLTAGAVAVLGYAYLKGTAEGEAYNKALITTGNVAGATSGKLAGMAQSVASATGATVGAAAEAMAQLAGTVGIASKQFESIAATAVMMEKATGVAMSETIKQFSDLGKEPVTASEKLNETTHYLTASIYEQIKALQDQGDKAGAAALAQGAYNDALKDRIPQLIDNLGWLEKAWKGVWGAAKGAGDAMLGIGRYADPVESLKKEISVREGFVKDKYTGSIPTDDAALNNLKQRLLMMEKGAGYESLSASMKAAQVKSDEASISLAKEADKYASNEVRLQREIAKARATYAAIKNPSEQDTANYAASVSGLVKSLGEKDKAVRAGAKTISDAEKAMAFYVDLMDEASGYSKSYAEEQNKLALALKSGSISYEQYAEAAQKVLNNQQFMKDAAKAEAEALQDRNKAFEDAVKAQDKQAKSVEDALKKQQEHNAGIGLSKEALAELEAATMLANAAELERQANLSDGVMRSPEIIDGLKREAQAMRDLATAKITGAQRQSGVDAANDMAKEQKKAAEASEKYWEDALMRAFESGKGFFESLWDTIKNTLETQVLKVTVQGVMGSLGIGAAGAAAAGQGGGNLLGVAGNLSSLYNTATSGIAASVGVVGNAAVASIQGMIGMTGTAAQAATAAANGLAYAATGSGSMLASIGAAAPYALAAVAAVAAVDLIKGLFSESREIERQGTQGTFSGTSFSGQNYTTTKVDPGFFSKTYHTTDYSAMDAKTASAWTDAFALLKSGVAASASTIGLATDKIAAYTKYIDIAAGTTAEQMTALFTGMADDMAAAVLGIKSTAFNEAEYLAQNPDVARNWGGTARQHYDMYGKAEGRAPNADKQVGVDYSSLVRDGETASVTLERLSSSLSVVNQWLGMFNDSLIATSVDGGALASKLVDTFGGADKFAASQSAYYAAMYTEAERLAKTTENVAKGLALVGQAMPSNIEDFNKLRDGISLTSEEGRNAYAVMTALGPEFAQVANAAKAAAASIASEHTRLQDQYDALTMTSAQLLAKQRSALDESNQALFDQINAQQDLKDAAEKAAAAAESLASANKGWQDQLDVLLGSQTERSIALRDTTDESTKALMSQVYAQQDLKDAAEKAVTAMKTLSTELDSVAAFKGTVGESQQGIRSQMAGYDAVAYGKSQVSKYAEKLASATDTAGRIEAGASLRDAVVGRYNAELELINKNKEAASASAQKAFDAQLEADNKAISSANTLNAAYRQIGDYAKGLLTGAHSPFSGQEQLQLSKVNYAQLLAGSRSGDTAAMGQLTSAADNYLSQARLQAVSSSDYARVFGRTVNDLSALGGRAGADIESVQRTFMADSSAFDKQALDLQNSAIAELERLASVTDAWTENLQTAMNEQALQMSLLGLTTAQTADYTSKIEAGFDRVAQAITGAQTAQQNADALLAQITELTAQVARLTAISQKTADNTKATADVLDSATGGGGPMLVESTSTRGGVLL